jgi:hypothetical protein
MVLNYGVIFIHVYGRIEIASEAASDDFGHVRSNFLTKNKTYNP